MSRPRCCGCGDYDQRVRLECASTLPTNRERVAAGDEGARTVRRSSPRMAGSQADEGTSMSGIAGGTTSGVGGAGWHPHPVAHEPLLAVEKEGRQ